ncbi:hypothetical protein HBB16_16955 [Pseudonocardia sp. MCCB 268]|nr:hypothetical protein [Pseudonocardia cytotoxica]
MASVARVQVLLAHLQVSDPTISTSYWSSGRGGRGRLASPFARADPPPSTSPDQTRWRPVRLPDHDSGRARRSPAPPDLL